MYCPKCSQQQTSEDVRFCPGCGFQLNSVAELLSNSGGLVTHKAKGNVCLFRRNEVRLGAKMLFFSAMLVPPAFLLSVIFDSPYPFVIPFVVFMTGLTQVLYHLLFGQPVPTQIPEVHRAGLNTTRRSLTLPTALSAPMPVDHFKHSNTAEMVKPPSITEHTTKLLDDSL